MLSIWSSSTSFPLRRHMIRRWDEPKDAEAADGYFRRLAGLNGQTSARVFANDMGFDGRELRPADCLEAVRMLPISGWEALSAATPRITSSEVVFGSERLRRRHWSNERRRACRGCLGESAHHRSWFDIVPLQECPFHGLPLVDEDDEGFPLSTWCVNPAETPYGRSLKVTSSARAEPLDTFEAFVLHRLGFAPRLCADVFDGAVLSDIIDAVEIAGVAVLGGWNARKPDGISLKSIYSAGYEILRGSPDAWEELFVSWHSEAQGKLGYTGRSWGITQLCGWLYPKLFLEELSPVLFGMRNAALKVAAKNGQLGNRAVTHHDIRDRGLISGNELGRRLGISPMLAVELAKRSGLSKSTTSWGYYALPKEYEEILRDILAHSVNRCGGAAILGLKLSDFNRLVQPGELLKPLVGGSCGRGARFRKSELASFVAETLSGLQPLSSLPNEAIPLEAFCRRSRMSIVSVIKMILAGTLRPLGILATGIGLNAIVLPLSRLPPVPPRQRASGPGLRFADVAARLGVTHITLVHLVRERPDLLSITPREANVYAPKSLDEAAVSRFERLYARATDYADVLGRNRNHVMQFLSTHGIQNLVSGGPRGVTAMVERRAVEAVFGTSVGTLSINGYPEWSDAFWAALTVYLRERKSVFRIVRKDAKLALLRSGDGKTVFSLILRPEQSVAILTLEVDVRGSPRRWRVLNRQRPRLALLDPGLEWFEDVDTGRMMLDATIDVDMTKHRIQSDLLQLIDRRINCLRDILGRRERPNTV